MPTAGNQIKRDITIPFPDHPECLPNVMVSAGMSEQDFGQLEKIIDAIPNLKFICLDVANGYSEHFVAFVKKVSC